MITLQNMIFANPQAYQVFPNMVNPYNTGTTELARYTGYLIITDNNGNTHSFTNTSAIDFTTISGLVTIDNVTDRGSVRLGRWQIAQSIIITNDITVTVTPIAEVSSDGATITPQYEVKHNTYHNGELTESIVITPDNVTLQSNVEWITISNNQIVVAANTNAEARQGQVTIQVSYQEYNTSANYDIVQAGYDIEQDIMQSMVLWYDIAKQGATNESMATTPTLIDHSGNGHDATCYNFAWSLMSGIGGYNMDSTDWAVYSSAEYTRPNATTIHITKVAPNNNDLLIAWISEHSTKKIPAGTKFTLPAIKYKVTGIKGNELRVYVRGDESGYSQVISDGVEYYFEGGEFTTSQDIICGFEIGWVDLNRTEREVDITVELLPSYPNALVSDGVDDYCLVEGLPILTKEKGYTVIAKRKWIITGLGAVCSKMRNNNGAFQLERVNGIVEYPNNSVSYNQYNPVTVNNDDAIVYQTTYDYNGSTSLSTKDVLDTDFMSICSVTSEIYSRHSGIVLYSLLLFDRDLTTEEIEWVKTNLIEAEQ